MPRISPCLALVAASWLLATGSPAQANPATPPQRVSVQAYCGANLMFPYWGGEVAYRAPLLDDRVGLYVSYSPYNMTLVAPYSTLEVGARYYLADHQDAWQPFAVASVGDAFGDASGGFPLANLGVGADWMFWESLGLSGSVCISFPWFVRPEVGIRLAF